ncbi:hypothetical protein [Pseudoalteromonas sp. GB56]
MLLEVAIGALRCLPKVEQKRFVTSLEEFVKSHDEWQLHAWAFYELTAHALIGLSQKKTVALSKPLIISACGQLLGALASFGHQDQDKQRAALHAAADTLQLSITYSDQAQCQLIRLHRALLILKSLPSVKKQALLEACQICVTHDGEVNEDEQVLLHTLAVCLDVDYQVFKSSPR